MAFILKQSDTYSWPVTIQVSMSGGRFDKQVFDAEFKRIGQTQAEEAMAAIAKGDRSVTDVLSEIFVGWSGVSDGSDEIPFSVSARDQMLEINRAASSIFEAWIESLTGAKKKN